MVKNPNSGQMLLVVVLTMIVALTVGLSVASRTVTNLKLSRQNDESERAFQAAEAGVQQVLQSGSALNNPNFQNNATYNIGSVSHLNGASIGLNGGEIVDQDSGLDVWLSNYPDFSSTMGNGSAASITLYWGTDNQTTCNTGGLSNVKSALEIAILSGNKLNPTFTKNLYEANTCGRIAGALAPTGGNVTPSGTSVHYQNYVTFTVTNGLIMKVIPIYNSSKIFAISNTGGVTFPPQGTLVQATGTAGDTVRKITYFASYPQIPVEMFPYALITQ